MKRLAAVLCSVALFCVLAAGCQKTPADTPSDGTLRTTVPDSAADTLKLAFNREDTLNPFSATTELNLQLASLLYDVLVRPDAVFSPVLSLAKTAEFTDKTHLTVTLQHRNFSDGSAVTVNDVLYSFRAAKASQNYGAALSNFSGVAGAKDSVIFTLVSPDPHAAACLYFPIIQQKTDTAAAAAAPVGSGMFVFRADTKTLTANPHAAKPAAVKTVELIHMVGNDTLLQNLENGSVDYLYSDLRDGAIPRTAVKSATVDLPRLVYIGVNSGREPLSAPTVRQAFSKALDRTSIAASAYTGRALPATSPFHPNWRPASGLTVAAAAADSAAVATLLQTAQTEPTADTPADTGAETAATTTAAAALPAELTLIYPAGNSCREAAVKMVIKQMAHSGIAVTAVPLSFADYQQRLAEGNYDLYIGEIALAPNMNLQVFFRAGGAAAFGVQPAGESAAAYAAYRDGTGAVADFMTAFAEEMPYIPLCWLQGMVASNRLSSDITPSAYALFDGIVN